MPAVSQALMLATGQTFRYLRFRCTKVVNSVLSINELEWYVGTTKYPTSNMTGASSPSPLVASASSEEPGYPAWEAFDGSLVENDSWLPTGANTIPAHLTLDLGAGNGIRPTSAKIAAWATGSRFPEDFTFDGSNDNTNWTNFRTLTGITSGWTGGTLREFTW